jgi:polyisoprenoid-binding protein YceI
MTTWKIDPQHAVAEFTVDHMMVTPVHGQFNGVSGAIQFDPTRPEEASVTVDVDVSGIYTGVDRRDNHLKSADFFDVERYPSMHFESIAVEAAGLHHCKVSGGLTIHGVTRPATFDVRFAGPSRFYDEDEQRMYTTFGFRATVSINREDFGMVWNVPIEDNGFMVGKHVDVILNAEVDLVED